MMFAHAHAVTDVDVTKQPRGKCMWCGGRGTTSRRNLRDTMHGGSYLGCPHGEMLAFLRVTTYRQRHLLGRSLELFEHVISITFREKFSLRTSS